MRLNSNRCRQSRQAGFIYVSTGLNFKRTRTRKERREVQPHLSRLVTGEGGQYSRQNTSRLDRKIIATALRLIPRSLVSSDRIQRIGRSSRPQYSVHWRLKVTGQMFSPPLLLLFPIRIVGTVCPSGAPIPVMFCLGYTLETVYSGVNRVVYCFLGQTTCRQGRGYRDCT